MTREAVVTDRIARPLGPFSAAVWDREALFVSGTVGQDPVTGKLVDGGVEIQTLQVLKNLEAVLAAAGKSFANVIKVNIYLADMRDFGIVNECYARCFAAPYPARTTVQVAALPLGAAVEMELVAR